MAKKTSPKNVQKRALKKSSNKTKRKPLNSKKIEEKTVSKSKKFSLKIILGVFLFILAFSMSLAYFLMFFAKKVYFFVDHGVKEEQVKAYGDVKNVLKEIEWKIYFFENMLLEFEKKAYFASDEDREEYLNNLRLLNEDLNKLNWEVGKYFSDDTIQYYPYAIKEVHSWVYEVLNFRLRGERFLDRADELVLESHLSSYQLAVLKSDFDAFMGYFFALKSKEEGLNLSSNL